LPVKATCGGGKKKEREVHEDARGKRGGTAVTGVCSHPVEWGVYWIETEEKDRGVIRGYAKTNARWLGGGLEKAESGPMG